MNSNPKPAVGDNRRLAMGYEPIERLQLNPRDPRTYSPPERRRVSRMLSRFGAIPLVVNAERVMLSGNIWLEAAKLAGFAEVPVVVADHLNPTEADAFMLAQVRLIERGEWDERLLGQVLRDLTVAEIDFDVSITGFEPSEIDLKIIALDDDANENDLADEAPPVGPPVTRPEDVWQLGEHRLLCGDALRPESYQALLCGELAAVIFSDPPYNVAIAGHVSGLGAITHREFAMGASEMSEGEFIDFLTTVTTCLAEHSVAGSLHYLAIDWRGMLALLTAGRRSYDSLQNVCVWSKGMGGMGSMYRSAHEFFAVFKKGKRPHTNNIQLGRFGRNRTNVWDYPRPVSFGRNGDDDNRRGEHPTIKPVALIADVLLDASVRGDLVLDPFMGSGSTIIAAEKVGRRARGIEIDPLYVDAAVRRFERWTGQPATLAADGRTFRDVELERCGGGRHGG